MSGAAAAGEIDVLRLLTSLGRALHRHGTPAHRLEDALRGLGESLGHEVSVFSTPTLVLIRVGPPAEGRASMLRVEPSGAVDLGRMAELDRVADEIAQGTRGVEAGLEAVRALEAAPPTYGALVTTLSFSLLSSAATVLFGGTSAEVAAAGGLGLGVGLLDALLDRFEGGRRLRYLLSAFAVALAGAAMGAWVRPPMVFLGALIVLVPGLTLTTAIAELATRSLVSGTARLTGAGLVFLQLVVGFGLAGRLTPGVLDASLPADAVVLPQASLLPALFAAAIGLQVIFSAQPRHLPWVMSSVAAATGAARLGAAALGPDVGALTGALAAGLVGNVGARWLRRPAVVGILPGLLLLVPGSLGIRALSALLAEEATVGLTTAFSTMVTAVSLVSGLFLANLLVSPRRSL